MESKYPEEIVEKVAKAMRRDMGGTKAQWEALPDDVLAVWRSQAIAALDALGLTVTEEVRVHYSFGVNSGTITGSDVASLLERQRRVTMGEINVDRVDNRTVLRAETPWEVVDQ